MVIFIRLIIEFEILIYIIFIKSEKITSNNSRYLKNTFTIEINIAGLEKDFDILRNLDFSSFDIQKSISTSRFFG